MKQENYTKVKDTNTCSQKKKKIKLKIVWWVYTKGVAFLYYAILD